MNRFIALIRKKTLIKNKRALNIVLDGKHYATLHNGEIIKITIDNNCHTLSVQSLDCKTKEFEQILIPDGNKNFVFQVSLENIRFGTIHKSCIKLNKI